MPGALRAETSLAALLDLQASHSPCSLREGRTSQALVYSEVTRVQAWSLSSLNEKRDVGALSWVSPHSCSWHPVLGRCQLFVLRLGTSVAGL